MSGLRHLQPDLSCCGAPLFIVIPVGIADGNVEPYEFSDIDRTVAAGLSLSGAAWGRAGDTVGIAGS